MATRLDERPAQIAGPAARYRSAVERADVWKAADMQMKAEIAARNALVAEKRLGLAERAEQRLQTTAEAAAALEQRKMQIKEKDEFRAMRDTIGFLDATAGLQGDEPDYEQQIVKNRTLFPAVNIKDPFLEKRLGYHAERRKRADEIRGLDADLKRKELEAAAGERGRLSARPEEDNTKEMESLVKANPWLTETLGPVDSKLRPGTQVFGRGLPTDREADKEGKGGNLSVVTPARLAVWERFNALTKGAKTAAPAAATPDVAPLPTAPAPVTPAPVSGKKYTREGDGIRFASGNDLGQSVQDALDDGLITPDQARETLRKNNWRPKGK